MKKFAFSVLVTFLLVVGCVACAPQKTEYDNKEVLKIETAFYAGESPMLYCPTRTFDFTSGAVTDELVLSASNYQWMIEMYESSPESYAEYESVEAYKAHLDSTYNRPEQISTFSDEQASALLREIKSGGIYNWEKHYEEDNVTCGGSYNITVSFADGTKKDTSFYLKHPRQYKSPKNYITIEEAFIKYCGAELFMEW